MGDGVAKFIHAIDPWLLRVKSQVTRSIAQRSCCIGWICRAQCGGDDIMLINKNFIQPEIRHKAMTVGEIHAMGMGRSLPLGVHAMTLDAHGTYGLRRNAIFIQQKTGGAAASIVGNGDAFRLLIHGQMAGPLSSARHIGEQVESAIICNREDCKCAGAILPRANRVKQTLLRMRAKETRVLVSCGKHQSG